MANKELSILLSKRLLSLQQLVLQYLVQNTENLHQKEAVLEQLLTELRHILPTNKTIDDEELYAYWKRYKKEELTWHTTTAPAYKAATTATYPTVLEAAVTQLNVIVTTANHYLQGYIAHKEVIVGAVMQQKFKAFSLEARQALDDPQHGWLFLQRLLQEKQAEYQRNQALSQEFKNYTQQYEALLKVWKTRVVPNANALLVEETDVETGQKLVQTMKDLKVFFEKAPTAFSTANPKWVALASAGKWEERLVSLKRRYNRSKSRKNALLEDGNPTIPADQEGNSYKASDKKMKLYRKGKGDKHEVAANDIQQGDLDDCYVLSPLAALVQHNPNFIKEMIEEQADGTYQVTLYLRKNPNSKQREKTVVSIQPEFVYNKKNKAAYAGEGDQERWVQVIEKAYAQALGHYDAIAEGGEALESFAVFTGKEGVKGVLQEKTQEELQQFFEEALDHKKAITISSVMLPNKQKRKKIDNMQEVVTNHVYYLKGVNSKWINLQNPSGQGHLKITWVTLLEYFKDYVML